MTVRKLEVAIAMVQELYPMDIQKRISYVEMRMAGMERR